MKNLYKLSLFLVAPVLIASMLYLGWGDAHRVTHPVITQAPERVPTQHTLIPAPTQTQGKQLASSPVWVPLPDEAVSNSQSSPIAGMIFPAAFPQKGIIGRDSVQQMDNPTDNQFYVNLNLDLKGDERVYLEYDLKGVADYTGVCRSVNDQLAVGGYLVRKGDTNWNLQQELISPAGLKKGNNVVRFSVPQDQFYSYEVRNVRLKVEAGKAAHTRKLVVNQPSTHYYHKKYGYIQGFVSGQDWELAKVSVNGETVRIHKGEFELLAQKPVQSDMQWSAIVTAVFPDGEHIEQEVFFDQAVEWDYLNGFDPALHYAEIRTNPSQEFNLSLAGMSVSGSAGALKEPVVLSITALRDIDFPNMGSGMSNVTGEHSGYRLLPHGTLFDTAITIALAYDPQKLPKGYTAKDIQTFYFDEQTNRWAGLHRDSVDEENHVIFSLTNHFTDFVNGIIKVPEMPETQAYTPNSIKDIKAANPLEGMQLMQPPTANNMGTANISYLLQVPAGRQGMQPNLALQYNSAGGNGWLGIGWDINIPAITVETRWGVPRFHTSHESESYLLNGEQLNPLAHKDVWALRNPNQTEKQFYPRVEGAFNKIIRHGNSPKNYYWEVIDKNGMRYFYGKVHGIDKYSNSFDPGAVLTAPYGNIAHWALTETRDLNGNTVRYYYDIVGDPGNTGGYSGKQIYIREIEYTGHQGEFDTAYEQGAYKVVFERINKNTNEASGYRRQDISISGRYGFKEVTADLLKGVKTYYQDELIKSYFFAYSRHESEKTLLCGLVETEVEDISLYYMPGVTVGCSSNFVTRDFLRCDAVEFFPVHHKFEYYDEPITFGDEITIENRNYNDNLLMELLSMKTKLTTSATALGGSQSSGWNIGGTLAAGFKGKEKRNSIGGNYTYGQSNSEGKATLIDLDGDGLPDKVFKDKHGYILFRKQVKVSENEYYFAPAVQLHGISDFLKDKSTSSVWGLEALVGFKLFRKEIKLNASGEKGTTTTTTSIYFADVNHDGLPDLIKDAVVYFNKLDENGNPSFHPVYTDTSVQVGENSCDTISFYGAVDPEVFDPTYKIPGDNCEDPLIPRDCSTYHYVVKTIENRHINFDAVRTWIAPFDGKIHISAPVNLRLDTEKVEDYSLRSGQVVDGVTASMQHNDILLIKKGIHPKYDTVAMMDTLRNVKKGDKLFFRLQSLSNRAFDIVHWDPLIQYVAVKDYTGTLKTLGQDSLLLDANNKGLYRFKASEDFLLSSPGMIEMPCKGILQVKTAIHFPELSDTVRFQIIKNRETVAYSETISGTSSYSMELDQSFTTSDTDAFEFKIIASSNVAWEDIAVDSLVCSFTSGDTIEGEFYPYMQHAIYQDILRLPQEVLGSGSVVSITPDLAFGAGSTGLSEDIILTAKSNNRILAKRTIQIGANGLIAGNTPFSMNIPSGTSPVYFEYFIKNRELAQKVSQSRVLIGSSQTPYQAGLYTPFSDSIIHLGNLYRGWGQFVYNDPEHLIQPHLLTLPAIEESEDQENRLEALQDTNIKSFDDLDSVYAANNLYDPLKSAFIPMQLSMNDHAWKGYGGYCRVSKDMLSNLQENAEDAEQDINLDDVENPIPPVVHIEIDYKEGRPIYTRKVFPAKSVQKKMKSENKGYAAGAAVKITNSTTISAGKSFSSGYSEMHSDYMDMNGDGYPDVVGIANVQYSSPWGGLSSLITPHVKYNFVSGKNSYGGGGNTFGTEYMKTEPIPSPSPSHAKYSTTGSSSASGSIGTAWNRTDYGWMDVNGDGLPDKVFSDNMVSLNYGYTFGELEPWSTGHIQEGTSVNASSPLPFKLPFESANKSFAAGFGASLSTNNVEYSMMDINGDGLVDMVGLIGGKLKVSYNTGAGFTGFDEEVDIDPVKINHGQALNLNANLAFDINIPIAMFKLCINPKISGQINFNREGAKFIDMNGDGLPDYVTCDLLDGLKIKVRYAQPAKKYILKSVANFAGGSFELAYTQSENTYRSPQRTWRLTQIAVNDGHEGDGIDNSVISIEYTEAYYNRFERQSFGCPMVKIHQYSPDGGIYRSTVQYYHNTDVTFKGIKYREIIQDGTERPYVEKQYCYVLHEIATGRPTEQCSGDKDPCANYSRNLYPALQEEKEIYYDNQGLIKKTMFKHYEYSTYGNVIVYKDQGDADPYDDYSVGITYFMDEGKYVVGIPQYMSVVDPVSDLTLRTRECSVDPNYNIERISLEQESGMWNHIDFKHDKYGNTTFMHSGGIGRHFMYDTLTHALTTQVQDDFGYSSTTEYDYKFQKPLLTVDRSGAAISYAYDRRGRVKEIWAPKELQEGIKPTIRFDYWDESMNFYYDCWTSKLEGWDHIRPLRGRTFHYLPDHPDHDLETVLFTDGLGRVIQTKKDAVIYDPYYGEERKMMTVSGTTAYDAFGRVVESRLPFIENTGMDTIFNSNGNFYQIPVTLTAYDLLDRVVATILPGGIGNYTEYDFGKDHWGRTRVKTTFTDGNGNKTTTYTNARGKQTMVVDALMNQTKFFYNPLGEMQSSVDPEGNTTRYSYDMLGRCIRREHPDAGMTDMAYNELGQLIQKIQNGVAVRYEYELNRPAAVTYPQNPENNIRYRYGKPGTGTAAGRVIWQEDITGVQTFDYDELGNVTRNRRSFGIMDPFLTVETQFEYDSWGRMKSILYPDNERVEYFYNTAGMLHHVESDRQGTLVSQIGYDHYGHKIRMVTGDNVVTQYEYDPGLQRLDKQKATDEWGTDLIDNTYTYDNVNNITQISKNPQEKNGMGGYSSAFFFGYDNLYRLTSAGGNAYNGQSNSYTLAMEYSPSGNILTKNQTHIAATSVPDASCSLSYQYNASRPHIPESTGEESFVFDNNGNMIQKNNSVTGINTTFVWDEDNRMMGGYSSDNKVFAYVYDAAGERAVKLSGDKYSWGVNGPPVTRIDFGSPILYANPYLVINNYGYSKHYYIEGQRIASSLQCDKDMQNEWFTKPIGLEDDGTPNWQPDETILPKPGMFEEYIYRSFLPFGNFNSVYLQYSSNYVACSSSYGSAELYFYRSDHLGSTSVVNDRFGNVTQVLEYLPFGEIFFEQRNNPYDSPLKFSAKELDEETGLYYFGARYYDPRNSIFLSVDPHADDYPHQSSYMYCGGNPIRYIDPTGMNYGDYYTESGKWFYNDGQNDDKAYVAKQGADGKPVGAKDLGISNTELLDRATWVHGECGGSEENISNRTQNAGDASTVSDARVADYYAGAINNAAKSDGGFYKAVAGRMSKKVNGETVNTSAGYFSGTGIGGNSNSKAFANARKEGMESLMNLSGAKTSISAVISSVTGGVDPTGGARAWLGSGSAANYVNNPSKVYTFPNGNKASFQFSFPSKGGAFNHTFYRR